MTQFEMTENLSAKCHVSLEEAKTALEAGEWNMLTAAQLLEDEKLRRMQAVDEVASGGEAAAVQVAPDAAEEAQASPVAAVEEAQPATAEKIEAEKEAPRVRARRERRHQGFKNLGEHIRRLVACGNRNRLVVRRGDAAVVELPVTVLVVLLLCAFWVCVPLLVIGLFAGCRYSFSGRELGREGINGALTKAADTADHMKQAVARA